MQRDVPRTSTPGEAVEYARVLASPTFCPSFSRRRYRIRACRPPKYSVGMKNVVPCSLRGVLLGSQPWTVTCELWAAGVGKRARAELRRADEML